MLLVNLIDVGTSISGRFLCLRVVISSSISLVNADQTSTRCPELANIRDKAIPHVPAPITPIVDISSNSPYFLATNYFGLYICKKLMKVDLSTQGLPFSLTFFLKSTYLNYYP